MPGPQTSTTVTTWVGVTTTVDATHRTISYRCPCCGDRGITISEPLSWSAS
jgi:hypothetical protein